MGVCGGFRGFGCWVVLLLGWASLICGGVLVSFCVRVCVDYGCCV